MNLAGRTLAAATACAVAAAGVTATGEASNHRANSPGEWVGVITFSGEATTASGQFEGSFELQSSGGAASVSRSS